jgi:ribonucleoside-diphosphate reductase alpha chain
LWDQKSPNGYLEICAILQKYIDQGISVNTSYNPEHYEDNKIPMSVILSDLISAYKYGIKQLYYFNTHDGAGEYEEELPPLESYIEDEEDCDACEI